MDRSCRLEAVAVILMAVALACAGSSTSTGPGPDGAGAEPRENPFPSAGELEGFGLDDLDISDEMLPRPQQPAPSAAAPPQQREVWERRRPGLVLPSEAMHCVARELGSFFLAHGGQPGKSLRRYIASRCNATVPAYNFAYVHTTLPESTPEAEIFEQIRGSVAEKLQSLVVGGACTAGIWFGRSGERVVALAVAGKRQIHVEPVATLPGPDARIALEGEVLAPAAEVSATIGRGRFGFAPCSPDPEVAAPRFAFVCEADPADESAVVSVSYLPPGRLLGKVGLDVRVWPSGQPNALYRRPAYGEKRTVATRDAARSQLVDLLNDVRIEAGLSPLVEAREQSLIASALAPHFFAAMTGDTAEALADVVAMGMIAGWSVEGMLQSGHFTFTWVSETDDVDRMLSEALEYPTGRAVLLDPDAEKVAVGPIVAADSESPRMAALIGTYSLFSESAHVENAEHVYQRFQVERSRRGLSPATRLDEIEPLGMAAASRVQVGVEPHEALDDLLKSSVDVLQRAVNGWIAEVSDLDDLEFPEDFLDRPSVGIAVGVSYHQPEDEPWGRYVVMLVAAGPRSHRL
jgi:hypothetical protein